MTGMLLREVARDRIKVRLGIAHRLDIRPPKHPNVDLLGELRCIRVLADTAEQERLQRSPVLREQSLHQCLFRFGHCEVREPGIYDPCNNLRVASHRFGYLNIAPHVAVPESAHPDSYQASGNSKQTEVSPCTPTHWPRAPGRSSAPSRSPAHFSA